MTFTAYNLEHHKTILVSGGGYDNILDPSLYSHAEIDIEYKEVEGENWFENIIAVYYKEYGTNDWYVKSTFIGNDIEWGENDNFRVLYNGRYVDKFGNETYEEDEEED